MNRFLTLELMSKVFKPDFRCVHFSSWMLKTTEIPGICLERWTLE